MSTNLIHMPSESLFKSLRKNVQWDSGENRLLQHTSKVPPLSLHQSINKHVLGIVVHFKLTHIIPYYHTDCNSPFRP